MPHTPIKRRILSIAFTHLQTDRIARMKWGKSWRLNDRPNAPPIVVTDTFKNAIRIIAAEECAAEKGVQREQTLSDARALIPDLDYHNATPGKAHNLLCRIAAWCERYTPLVALSTETANPANTDYGLFMDTSGCAHLFGGEKSMIADIESRLLSKGFHVKLCLADTPGAAWAMARYGPRKSIRLDKDKEQLLTLPLAALRLPQTSVTALARVGLKTIGCIADLPRAPLAARFGRQPLERLDQALGHQDEAISPLMPVAELLSEKRFPEPIVYEDDIIETIEILAQNIALRLEERGLGARACRIKLFRVDGKTALLEVESARPVRGAKQIARLFKEKIAGLHDDLDAGFGFDLIRLESLRTSSFESTQNAIALDDHAPPSLSDDGYAALIDRLGARLGVDRVQQFVLADTHIPERSFGFAPYVNSGVNSDVNSAAASHMGFAEPAPLPTRPIILLERPERMETLAQVPDGAPIRFRWRKVLYEVAKSEGPERIACEWWKDGRASKTRDYFRVEDDQGYRFWVFRYGLYGREVKTPHWYMHGLFS